MEAQMKEYHVRLILPLIPNFFSLGESYLYEYFKKDFDVKFKEELEKIKIKQDSVIIKETYCFKNIVESTIVYDLLISGREITEDDILGGQIESMLEKIS